MRSSPSHSNEKLRKLAAEALPALAEAAREGGLIALRDFRAGGATSASIEYKHGGSPVTSADMAVDAFLKHRLSHRFPEAGWLSEETADNMGRLTRSALLIVDPIDGTRAFLSGDPRWTVSIAIAIDGLPVAGVVHAPALGETYAASAGDGVTLNGAPVRASLRDALHGAKVAGPRPLVQSLAAALKVEFPPEPKIPSLAYRLALVAAGALDAALASADAHDWDIAAADILLSEAGARLLGADGAPLRYNKAATRHEALLAAPEGWLPAMVPAFAEALAGRRHGT